MKMKKKELHELLNFFCQMYTTTTTTTYCLEHIFVSHELQERVKLRKEIFTFLTPCSGMSSLKFLYKLHVQVFQTACGLWKY